MILLSVLGGQMGPSLWLPVMIKFLMEGLVLIVGARLFGYWHLMLFYPIWFLIQPLYISFVGLLGLRGKFSWKP